MSSHSTEDSLIFFLSSIYLNSIRTLKFRLNSGLPSPDGVNEMEVHGHFDAIFGRMSRESLLLIILVYLVIWLRRIRDGLSLAEDVVTARSVLPLSF